MAAPTTRPGVGVRVSRSGPVLSFRFPVVSAWVAVPTMVLVVAVMVVAAVVAVVS